MKDPFKPKTPTIVTVANAVVPVLLDRLGGSAVVTQGEHAALVERYGGRVGVQALEESPGVYRLTLVRMDPAPVDPGVPVS